MSYNTVLADFQNILNRDDATAAQLQIFIVQAIQRIQRECRLPCMERTLITNCTDTVNFIMAPADLIQPIDMIWVPAAQGTPGARGFKPKPLIRLPYRDLLGINPTKLPEAYGRNQTQFWVRGAAVANEELVFLYYGNFSNFATPDSDNEITAAAPDLVVYGALSYAADYFQHPLASQWEARYQAIKQSTIDLAEDLDREGGFQSIAPLYNQMEY